MSLLRIYHQRRNRRDVSQGGRFYGFIMMTLGFLMALIVCTAVFEILNLQFHWTDRQLAAVSGGVKLASQGIENVHSAAPKTQETTGSQLIISSEKTKTTYVVPGQKDVPLYHFSLSPTNDGFIHAMTFVLGDLSHPYDLQKLKLYLGDSLIGEVLFFDGKGTFQNLMMKLKANQLMSFQIVGTVSEQAQPGDRLILQLADQLGIDAVDADGIHFDIVGRTTALGQPISIVHGHSSQIDLVKSEGL
jgi:hypothetical protein